MICKLMINKNENICSCLLKGSGYSWMENIGSQNEVWCVADGET